MANINCNHYCLLSITEENRFNDSIYTLFLKQREHLFFFYKNHLLITNYSKDLIAVLLNCEYFSKFLENVPACKQGCHLMKSEKRKIEERKIVKDGKKVEV